jgi:hypothetical protein
LTRTTAAAPILRWGGGETVDGTVFIGPEGKGTVTVSVYGGDSSRSVAGLDRSVIAGKAFLNYYQFIMVDDADRSQIWAFDEAIRGTDNETLFAPVEAGHRYHFLLLGGYIDKDSTTENPTLLVSAYYQHYAEPGIHSFTFAQTPLVIDTAFVEKNSNFASFA